MSNCLNCLSATKNDSSITRCDGCLGRLHLACVGLTEGDMVMTRTRSRSMKLVCNSCSGNMSQFKDIKLLIGSLKTEFTNIMSDLKTELNEKLTTFRREINEEMRALERGTFGVEEVLQELNDRQARKQNIIMFNVPEQSGQTDADSRAAAENVEVSLMLRSLIPSLDMSGVKLHRLGRFNPSAPSPRPVKVALGSEDDVHAVIRSCNRLRNNPEYSRIAVSYDRTPRQLADYRNLKVQLNERIGNGESNLKIKYIRGAPKIVPLNGAGNPNTD